MLLELCINTGQACQSLGEIDITRIPTDYVLFNYVRQRYREIRSSGLKKHFLKPKSIRFVSFLLEDGADVHILDGPSPDLPMENEVSKSRWHYTPCPPRPAENPMPGNVFVHYLLYKHKRARQPTRPGKKFRFHRLPKKLNGPLRRPTGDYVTAWGVHIIEGPAGHASHLLDYDMYSTAFLHSSRRIYHLQKRYSRRVRIDSCCNRYTLLYSMMKASEQDN
ncbi:hypothetical protein F5884DRAFT_342933 [Xylogone sp. PMI_703]|nr:hypothetical protein F5884DRAFT_342933 [Xylogone sp. PMI_703]